MAVGAAVFAAVIAGACAGDSGAKPETPPSVPVESSTVATAQATAGVRVLIIGTSLTAGLGLSTESAYPAVMQRLADSAGFRATIDAAGLSGETSAGALRRVDWLLRDPADVVVIETGANDGLRGLDVDTTRANLVAIIGKVRAANPASRVLLAQMEAPPNLGARYTRGFHEAYMTVARDEGVILIPFFLEGVAGDRAMNQEDGIHPNVEGAHRAARNMWKTLGPVLRDTPGARPR